jgi:putative aldouronate transport system permease protein
MIRAVFVSLGRLAVGVPYGVFLAFISSYALSKKYLPGRRAIIFLLLIPSYIGGGLIPTYILFAGIGLLNNPLVYVLPTGFGFFGFILLRTYMHTVPDSLEESARLDGAGDYAIMWKIYFPLCTPIIATLVLFSCVGHWNDWTTTLYFLTNNRWNTLAYELQRVLMEQDRIAKLMQEAIMNGQIPRSSTGTSQGVKNAQIILTTLPIIAAYPFLQKYFIQGMLVGGVKE